MEILLKCYTKVDLKPNCSDLHNVDIQKHTSFVEMLQGIKSACQVRFSISN